MITPNSFYIHPTSTPEPTPEPAPAAGAAKANAMFDHPSSKPTAAAPSPHRPGPTPALSAEERDERMGNILFSAEPVAGISDAWRGATADLISKGQLDRAEVDKAEVAVAKIFRSAKAQSIMESAISARAGRPPLTAAKEKAMQLDTLQRLRTEWGDRLPEVRTAIASWMAANPAVRDWLGGYCNDPQVSVKIADLAWRNRKK